MVPLLWHGEPRGEQVVGGIVGVVLAHGTHYMCMIRTHCTLHTIYAAAHTPEDDERLISNIENIIQCEIFELSQNIQTTYSPISLTCA